MFMLVMKCLYENADSALRVPTVVLKWRENIIRHLTVPHLLLLVLLHLWREQKAQQYSRVHDKS